MGGSPGGKEWAGLGGGRELSLQPSGAPARRGGGDPGAPAPAGGFLPRAGAGSRGAFRHPGSALGTASFAPSVPVRYTFVLMKVIVEEIETLVSRAGAHPIWGYTHCLRGFARAGER